MTADSRLRISGLALESVGAVEANYFQANLAAFMLAIIVALTVVAIWPEQSPTAAKNADQ